MLRSVPVVPILEALTVEDVKNSGSSRPLSMICARREGDRVERSEYIVKLYNDAPFKKSSLARELIAALLGQVLGLRIPATAIVVLSDELCRALQGSKWKVKVCKSLGENFGSKAISDPKTVREIPGDLIQEAAEIFAFDMLIQNLDRNNAKPNMFQVSEGLVPYDHEKSFICARPDILLGVIPDPWDFSSLNPDLHLFYKGLKGSAVTFEGFAEKLASLPNELIDDIMSQIPQEWVSSEIDRIRVHIMSARDNVAKFKRSLQEVLA